jgi:hypothetical protein
MYLVEENLSSEESSNIYVCMYVCIYSYIYINYK